MTDNELLAFMGTDAVRWAEEFRKISVKLSLDDRLDIGFLIGWFANALEAGRRATEFAAVIDEARQRYDSDDGSAAGDGGWSTHIGPTE